MAPEEPCESNPETRQTHPDLGRPSPGFSVWTLTSNPETRRSTQLDSPPGYSRRGHGCNRGDCSRLVIAMGMFGATAHMGSVYRLVSGFLLTWVSRQQSYRTADSPDQLAWVEGWRV
jgi:hypothetical protein